MKTQNSESETAPAVDLHRVDGRLREICERKVEQWEKVASGLNAGDPAKTHAEHMRDVWKRKAERRKPSIDPKLSDGGAWRGACPTVERTKDAQM